MPEPARLVGEIEAAASTLSAYWPLPGFVAINPLRGWDSLPFEEAVVRAGRLHGGRGYLAEETTPSHKEDAPRWPAAAAAVNRHLIQALSAFCDQGQARWPMPGRERGFYRAWRDVARHDPSLKGRRRLGELPTDALACLQKLTADIAPGDCRIAFFEAQLHALPGWAAYLRWRNQQDGASWRQEPPVSLADFLAVRLALCHCMGIGAEVPKAAGGQCPDREAMSQLRAREARWRQPLLEALAARGATEMTEPKPETAAQLVFCIDVRSEVLRRHLEGVGPYETLGFAGFFGVPIAWQGLDAEHAVASCPVLVDAQHLIREQPHRRGTAAVSRWRQRRRRRAVLTRLMDALKGGISAPFAFVEASGWAFGWSTARANLAPASTRSEGLPPCAATRVQLIDTDGAGIPFERQVFYAEAALSTMGLTRDFAPLVVLCGHAGETVNNPYARALDCGACGGHAGGPNARVLAQILNQRRVRAALAERGIAIPETTCFLPAEHNTTTDTVTLLDNESEATGNHSDALAALRADLDRARRAAASERCRALPGAAGDPVAAVERRARDWSEVRPEWGLAGNAAFIVGPRALTRDRDLAGRCFLHSYDWRTDKKGKGLELILTAPMIVAHWINAQYYFSTVDPEVFGAGTKTTQTVVGGFGVMQGNGSDLMTGLPRQSVMRADGRPQHEPLRLLTVVHAPVARIETIIRRNGLLQRLFDNEWVSLAALPPDGDGPLIRLPGGAWQPPASVDSLGARSCSAGTPTHPPWSHADEPRRPGFDIPRRQEDRDHRARR